jgi:hypothetical protein
MNPGTAVKSIRLLGEGVSTLVKALAEPDEPLLHETDLDRLRQTRQKLDAVAPGCLLVRMLDRQIATRMKAKRIRRAEAASLRLSRCKTLAGICSWVQHDWGPQGSDARRYLHGV